MGLHERAIGAPREKARAEIGLEVEGAVTQLVGREDLAHHAEGVGLLGVDRIASSPYVRCRDSVVPLARALDLEIEERDELAEGAVADELWSLVAELAPTTAVLCTHGDILGLLLGEEPEKGSTWLVDVEDGRGLARRTYLPPPG